MRSPSENARAGWRSQGDREENGAWNNNGESDGAWNNNGKSGNKKEDGAWNNKNDSWKKKDDDAWGNKNDAWKKKDGEKSDYWKKQEDDDDSWGKSWKGNDERKPDSSLQWKEPMTRTPPGKQVHLPGVVGDDEGLRNWLRHEAPKHLEKFGGKPLDCVDVSYNNLTDRGANMLTRFLLQHRLPTRRVKLFHNQLENPIDICELIEDSVCGVGSRDGLTELHMSHNFVTAKFLGSVLTSVSRRVRDAGNLRPPLWLRVERNGDLKSDADAGRCLETPGLKLCFNGGSKQSGCTLRSCKQGADVHVVFTAGKK